MSIKRQIKRNQKSRISPLPHGKYFQRVKTLKDSIRALEKELAQAKPNSRAHRKITKLLQEEREALNHVQNL